VAYFIENQTVAETMNTSKKLIGYVFYLIIGAIAAFLLFKYLIFKG
jgi:hypothetical protein